METANAIQISELTSPGFLQRYRLKRWLARHPAFVRTCKLICSDGANATLIRLIYVSTCPDYSSAERQAEECLKVLLNQAWLGCDATTAPEWKRGRYVTAQTYASEDDTVKQVVNRLFINRASASVFYEKITGYEGRRAQSAQPKPNRQTATVD